MVKAVRTIVVGMLALTTLLAGCGSGASGVLSAPAGEHRLIWQMWLSGSEDRAAWQRVADQVNADNPDLTVRLRGSPWENYWEKIGALLASGDAPCLISMQGPLTAGYADALLPLDDLMARHGVRPEEFDQPALEGMKVDGRQRALPYDTGPIVMYYNRDMFRQRGVPEPRPGWTMADFKRSAKKLTGKGTYGFAPVPEDDFQTAAWVLNLGGGSVMRDGELALTDAKFRRGYERYVKLIRDGGITPQLPAQAAAYVETQFSAGKFAMMPSGPWSMQPLRAQTKFELGVAPLPAGPNGTRSIAGGSGFGIAESCSEPDAAFRALKVMTGPDSLRQLGKEGRAFPTRPAVQESWYSSASDVHQVRPSLDYALERAEPYRTSTDWSQVKELLARSTQQALSGEIPIDEALRRVQNQQVP